MAQIGIMIEGQDGLNWTRWQRLLQAAEDFGYQCVFRSDHFTNASGEDKDSLELWVSQVYAASHTQRIEFGSLVAPITFRHPSISVRMAAAVADLSGGRFFYGMGAGWQEREHRKFGVPFYDFSQRYEMLTEGLELTKRLLESDQPVYFKGEHFQLEDAILLPRPEHRVPILIGGNGPTKTLPLAAKYANEWNGVFIDPPKYKERNALLTDLLRKEGRDPSTVKRSLMTQIVFGETDARVREVAQKLGSKLDNQALVVGGASAVIDKLNAFVEAGVERFMLQWLDQDNIADLEIIARDVLPHFHK